MPILYNEIDTDKSKYFLIIYNNLLYLVQKIIKN